MSHCKKQECCCPCHEQEHESSCCHDDTCSIAHHDNHDHGSFTHQLYELADEAWMELLKKKIQDQIEATSGKELNSLAKIVSQANHTKWKNKSGSYRSKEEFHEKLKAFFHK